VKVKDLVVLIIIVGAVAWHFNKRESADPQPLRGTESDLLLVERPSGYRCEGKTRCSQMSSCEEATFYLQNCPGTEMDGDRDGIPCESQYCGR
jgi:hypothetical protein